MSKPMKETHPKLTLDHIDPEAFENFSELRVTCEIRGNVLESYLDSLQTEVNFQQSKATSNNGCCAGFDPTKASTALANTATQLASLVQINATLASQIATVAGNASAATQAAQVAESAAEAQNLLAAYEAAVPQKITKEVSPSSVWSSITAFFQSLMRSFFSFLKLTAAQPATAEAVTTAITEASVAAEQALASKSIAMNFQTRQEKKNATQQQLKASVDVMTESLKALVLQTKEVSDTASTLLIEEPTVACLPKFFKCGEDALAGIVSKTAGLVTMLAEFTKQNIQLVYAAALLTGKTEVADAADKINQIATLVQETYAPLVTAPACPSTDNSPPIDTVPSSTPETDAPPQRSTKTVQHA